MALGTHWEWRAFGALSYGFRQRFESLGDLFPSQSIVDEYIWVPDLPINLKLRSGTAALDGLKLKRPGRTDGELEEWQEDLRDIHDFPLSRSAWRSLGQALAGAGMTLVPYPDEPPDRQGTLDALRKSDERIRVVTVAKTRLARLWTGVGSDAIVELAEISAPVAVSSVAVEREELEVMSYLSALGRWV